MVAKTKKVKKASAQRKSYPKSRLVIAGFLLVLLAFFVLQGMSKNSMQKESSSTEKMSSEQSRIESMLQSAKVTISDFNVDVVLKDGQANIATDPSYGSVQFTKVLAVHQTPDGNDVYAELVVNGGGSGSFVYVVLFHEQANTMNQTSFVNVGDRVVVQNVTTPDDMNETYTAAVSYLDREATDAMVVTPHVAKDLKLSVTDHTFTVTSE